MSKPTYKDPFNISQDKLEITPTEFARRKRKYHRLEKLGIDPTLVEDDKYSVFDNPYLIEAMVYIADDKDVPEEVVKKIEEFNKEHNINHQTEV